MEGGEFGDDRLQDIKFSRGRKKFGRALNGDWDETKPYKAGATKMAAWSLVVKRHLLLLGVNVNVKVEFFLVRMAW